MNLRVERIKMWNFTVFTFLRRSPVALLSIGAIACVSELALASLPPRPVAFEERLGITHAAPKYNALGALTPNILHEGAQDALQLGFRTFKFWLSREAVSQQYMYQLTSASVPTVTSLVETARLPQFSNVLGLAFKTFIMNTDTIGPGSINELRRGPMTQASRDNLYREIYELTVHLLRTYEDTGKTFILGNHEGDWYIQPLDASGQLDMAQDPTQQSLQIFSDFWTIRQQAVADARLAVRPRNVHVYHLCEVVRVVPGWKRGARTLTTDVLPYVPCDLVGYSSYDSIYQEDGDFANSLAHIKARRRPSPVFGDDNIVVSEIGAAEREMPGHVRSVGRAIPEALARRVPWIVLWALYDNECYLSPGVPVPPTQEATADQCRGFWMRRPDGSVGNAAQMILPYLAGHAPSSMVEPADHTAYVHWLYRTFLGRDCDPPSLSSALAFLSGSVARRIDLVKLIASSPEYSGQSRGVPGLLINDLFRAMLERLPGPENLPFVWPSWQANQWVDAISPSPEYHLHFVRMLYRVYAGREGDSEGVAFWLSSLRQTNDFGGIEAAFRQHF